MRTLRHYIIGFSVLAGVILLNALIATRITSRLNVSDTVRTMINVIVLCTIIATVVKVSWMIDKRRAARFRAAFLSGRSPLSNDDYFRELGLEDEQPRRIARAIRDAIAREIALPSEMVRPSDALDTLVKGITYGVPVPLEPAREAVKSELGADYDWQFEMIENQEGRGPAWAGTFREFVEFYLKNLDRLMAPPEPARK